MDSSKIQERVDMKYFRLTPYVFALGVTYSVVYASDVKLFNGLRSGFLQRCSNTATGFITLPQSKKEGGKYRRDLTLHKYLCKTRQMSHDYWNLTRQIDRKILSQNFDISSKIQEFSVFHEACSFITLFTPLHVPVLSQMHPIHATQSYFLRSSHPRLGLHIVFFI